MQHNKQHMFDLLFIWILNFLILLLRCWVINDATLCWFTNQNLYLNSTGLLFKPNHFNIDPQILLDSSLNCKSYGFWINFTLGNNLSQIICFNTKFKPFWPCNKAADRSIAGLYVISDILLWTVIKLGVLGLHLYRIIKSST